MTTDTTAPTAAANPNEAGQDSPRQGPGRLIRLGRERARIGISELAGLTKLAPATLEALERDDFTMLSEPVYVRGYYRKCAKALALSEQELLAAYEKVVAPRAPQAPTKLLLGGSETGSSLKKNRRRGGGGGAPWLMWLIGIVLLVAVAAWFLREDPNGHRPVLADVPGAANPVPALPAASEPSAAVPSAAADGAASKPLSTNELATTPAESGQSGAAQAAAPSVSQPSVSASGPQPTLATELSAPPAAATATPAGPAPAGALTLGFKATSWVRVEDSSGKVLLSGVVQSGDRQVLAGKAPYSLFLGNAPGVSVEYQGQAIDLKPFIKSNDTARLSVPAGGG
ncbi:MAG: RodZ domain-containing protein [Nevskiales bacterium]